MSGTDPGSPGARPVRDALARLGIDRLVVSLHQASFPAGGDDIGHGTPHAEPAGELLAFAAELGFHGVAVGPAGITSRGNASPYDATALSRNPLHIAFGPLCGPAWEAILDPRLLAHAVACRPPGDRVTYQYAWDAQRRLLDAAAAGPGCAPAWPSFARAPPGWPARSASRRSPPASATATGGCGRTRRRSTRARASGSRSSSSSCTSSTPPFSAGCARRA
jgi:hypothetical protein